MTAPKKPRKPTARKKSTRAEAAAPLVAAPARPTVWERLRQFFRDLWSEL